MAKARYLGIARNKAHLGLIRLCDGDKVIYELNTL